jgi:hypothetical protein
VEVKRHRQTILNATSIGELPKGKGFLEMRKKYMRVAAKLTKARGIIPYGTKNQKKLEMLKIAIRHVQANEALNNRGICPSTWRSLRELTFRKYGRQCMRCSSVENLAIDHIYPVAFYPSRREDESNLQVLCQSCNSSKGTKIKSYI